MTKPTKREYKRKEDAMKALQKDKTVAAVEKSGDETYKVRTAADTRVILMEQKAKEKLARQKAVLTALCEVETLSDKNDGEKIGVWFPFKEINKSKSASGINPRSLGGITRGLMNRGWVIVDLKGDVIGKCTAAVSLTSAGIAIARA